MSKKKTHKQWLEKFQKIHGNTYSYPYFKQNKLIKGSKTKIDIKCKKHGIFQQVIHNHTNFNGCPKCANEEQRIIPIELTKIANRLRNRVGQSFRLRSYERDSKSYEILGCDWETFKEHLENNSYGFKVDNTNIDLDHIIPICFATNRSEVYELNHYTNFQLLPSYYNRHIKSGSKFNREHFESWYALNRIN